MCLRKLKMRSTTFSRLKTKLLKNNSGSFKFLHNKINENGGITCPVSRSLFHCHKVLAHRQKAEANAVCFKPYDNSWMQPLTPAKKLALRKTKEEEVPWA